jgi:hypothetical protein
MYRGWVDKALRGSWAKACRDATSDRRSLVTDQGQDMNHDCSLDTFDCECSLWRSWYTLTLPASIDALRTEYNVHTYYQVLCCCYAAESRSERQVIVSNHQLMGPQTCCYARFDFIGGEYLLLIGICINCSALPQPTAHKHLSTMGHLTFSP